MLSGKESWTRRQPVQNLHRFNPRIDLRVTSINAKDNRFPIGNPSLLILFALKKDSSTSTYPLKGLCNRVISYMRSRISLRSLLTEFRFEPLKFDICTAVKSSLNSRNISLNLRSEKCVCFMYLFLIELQLITKIFAS